MHVPAEYDWVATEYRYLLVAALKARGLLARPELEETFLRVPRHVFIDELYVRDEAKGTFDRLDADTSSEAGWRQVLDLIYTDDGLVTGLDGMGLPVSSSTAPWLMAQMLEALQLAKGLRVLEIGTGTGYNAALIACLVGDPRLMTTIEINASLAHRAAERIRHVLGGEVSIQIGNGLLGYSSGAPYDRIIATAGYHYVPADWLSQLADDGILVMNLKGNLMGMILALRKTGRLAGTTAIGHFLDTPPVTFISLEDRQCPTTTVTDIISNFMDRSTRRGVKAASDEFPLSSVEDSGFLFLLQLEIPGIQVFWLPKPNMFSSQPTIADFNLHLFEPATKTVIMFGEANPDGSVQVEVEGDLRVWDRLKTAYRRWTDLGKPKPTRYIYMVDPEGQQSVVLTQASPPPVWRLA